jgi:hypothetical protein
VITKKLPLAQNLLQAKAAFDIPTLSPHEALYLGLIPALFYCSKMGNLPSQRRTSAIQQYVDSGITVEKATELLLTMLTGNHAHVPIFFRELMDIDIKMVEGEESPIARWIPHHMTPVLESLAQSTSLQPRIRCCLAGICFQLATFKNHKEQSGDGWEALFIVALLVRCVTNTFCELVPLQGSY